MYPPSTGKVVPVIMEDLSLSRNMMALTTSIDSETDKQTKLAYMFFCGWVQWKVPLS